MLTRRFLLGSAIGAGLAPLAARGLRAADKPSEIRIDWATYNPVSMVLKDKGLLEKEFAKDGITIRSSSQAKQRRSTVRPRVGTRALGCR